MTHPPHRSGIGLTEAQADVLNTLRGAESTITVVAIEAETGIDRKRVRLILDQLRALGLVVRHAAQHGRWEATPTRHQLVAEVETLRALVEARS